MPPCPGLLASAGFDADVKDNLGFVMLEPLAAGQTIVFTDNEWTGSAFNRGEVVGSWTAA